MTGGAGGTSVKTEQPVPSGYKIQLPTFNGVESSKLRADDFIEKVEACGIVYGWADVHMIRATSMNLTNIANTWCNNLFHDEEATKTTWKLFKERFLDRFHRKATPTEQSAYLDKLKQRPTESVEDLMDRIKRTLRELEIDKGQTIFYFIQGMHSHIRLKVQEIPHLETEEDYLRTARSIERALPSNQKIIDIASLETETQDEEKDSKESITDEIASLQHRIEVLTSTIRPKPKKGKKRAPYRPVGAGGRSGTVGVRSNPGSNIFCYRCRRYGNHLAKQCPVPQELLATIVPDIPHPSSTFGSYGISSMQTMDANDDNRYRFISLENEVSQSGN
jgi:hypothetical protein